MPNELLSQAIQLARDGQTNEARALLLQILKSEPSNEAAWMWLVQVLPNNTQRIAALEQCLKFNPGSEKARQGLERLRAFTLAPASTTEPVHPVSGTVSPRVETAAPPLPQVPRFQAGDRPTQPPPHKPIDPPSDTSPRPLILGKTGADKKPTPKPSLADLLRRKTRPVEAIPNEDDLGLSLDIEDRVVKPLPPTPKMPPEEVESQAEETPPLNPQRVLEAGGTPEDEQALQKLRTKAKKRSASTKPVTFRSVFRILLFIFYLIVFVAGGYYIAQRFGADIRAFFDANVVSLIVKPTAMPALEPSPAPSATEVLPTWESTEPAPTDTPVPFIGQRPAESNGRIVFSAANPEDPDQNLDIFAFPAEGGEIQNLTPAGSGNDLDPALTLNGRLVYSRDWKDLYLVEPDGKSSRLTSNGAGNREPAWSPDGQTIAFVSERDGNAEIYLIPSQGGQALRLTNAPGMDLSPVWSPDGARLAFISDRDGFLELYTMNTDGSGVIRLTYDLSQNFSPDWSPDGRWITYSGFRDGDAEIYTITPDGSQLNRLTFSPAAENDPVWSADGHWILFTSDRDPSGLSTLYVMRNDGSMPSALLDQAPNGLQSGSWAR